MNTCHIAGKGKRSAASVAECVQILDQERRAEWKAVLPRASLTLPFCCKFCDTDYIFSIAFHLHCPHCLILGFGSCSKHLDLVEMTPRPLSGKLGRYL